MSHPQEVGIQHRTGEETLPAGRLLPAPRLPPGSVRRGQGGEVKGGDLPVLGEIEPGQEDVPAEGSAE